jgi:hypothetical protein
LALISSGIKEIDYKLRHCDTVPLEANCYWGEGLNEGGMLPQKIFAIPKTWKSIFIKVVNFLHLKIQDFVTNFRTFMVRTPAPTSNDPVITICHSTSTGC